MTDWQQIEIQLTAKPRGCHLVTGEILKQASVIAPYRIGLAHFFLLHTSASISINENADPTVRSDMEAHLNVLVPENAPYYQHTLEGSDDMPAHIKSSLFGNSLSIPISNGQLALGTWQGIYLCEHRNHGGPRSLIITTQGETN